jgi:hypothetical protein
MLELWVNEQLKFIASEVLLMLCVEVKAEAVPAGVGAAAFARG